MVSLWLTSDEYFSTAPVKFPSSNRLSFSSFAYLRILGVRIENKLYPRILQQTRQIDKLFVLNMFKFSYGLNVFVFVWVVSYAEALVVERGE